MQPLDARVPDVIVGDSEMPRMGGCELARRTRASERLKDIPLVMISSRAGEKHRRHSLDFWCRPLSRQAFPGETDLLDGINTLLAKASP